MLSPLALLLPLVLMSCGGLNLFPDDITSARDRQVALLAAERLVSAEESTFEEEIDDRLRSLHSYYVIGQGTLRRFEATLGARSAGELLADRSYISLLALRTQVLELEEDLVEVHRSAVSSGHKARGKLLRARIAAFSRRGPMEGLSVLNLAGKIALPLPVAARDVSEAELAAAYRALEKTREFLIFEKNIEHLSHVIEVGRRGPASAVPVTEWPRKVWALSFHAGTETRLPALLEERLARYNFSATVFRNPGAPFTQPKQAGTEIAELSPKGSDHDEALPAPLAQAKERGLAGISNVDALDWPPQSPDRIIERTKLLLRSSPRDAGVVYFHLTTGRSALAAAAIMEELSRDARRVCALGTIVHDINQGRKTVCSKI